MSLLHDCQASLMLPPPRLLYYNVLYLLWSQINSFFSKLAFWVFCFVFVFGQSILSQQWKVTNTVGEADIYPGGGRCSLATEMVGRKCKSGYKKGARDVWRARDMINRCWVLVPFASESLWNDRKGHMEQLQLTVYIHIYFIRPCLTKDSLRHCSSVPDTILRASAYDIII